MIAKAIFVALCVTFCAAIMSNPAIFRPCNLRDLSCIQNTLSSSSGCRPVRGTALPQYSLERAHFDTAAFNASYDDVNFVIRGLDRCYVSEFYINRRTNVRFLAIDCPWVTFESTRIMYQHYLRQEDGVFQYNINGSYPLLTMNTPFTRRDLDLCKSYSNIYVHALPIFNINPLDRPTSNHLTRDLAALGVFEQETFAARAQLLTRLVINNMICNFGCN